MKRIALVCVLGLLVCVAIFADHSGKFGLGGVAGVGYSNLHGADIYPGFSLGHKAGSVPLIWGFYTRPFSLGIGVTGDFYLFEWNLVEKTATNDDGSYDVKIDWYLGLGFSVDTHFRYYVDFDIGGRIPFGVSWHATKNLEVAAGIAPRFGISLISDKSRFHFSFPVEVAVRHWW